MTLSSEQRQELQAKVSELRIEVASLADQREAAFRDQNQSLEDAKLIAEVVRLQKERDEAEALRDQAINSTQDALAIMQQAIETQVAAQHEVEPEAEPDPKVEPQVEHEDQKEESPPSEALLLPDAKVENTKNKGGNR